MCGRKSAAGPRARVKGEPADIVAVTRDIFRAKEQEQALVEARDEALAASRAKSRFPRQYEP